MGEVGSEYDVVLAADISSPDQTHVALGRSEEDRPLLQHFDRRTRLTKKREAHRLDHRHRVQPRWRAARHGDRSNGLIVWEAYTGREFYVLTSHTRRDHRRHLVARFQSARLRQRRFQDQALENGERHARKDFGAHGGGVTGRPVYGVTAPGVVRPRSHAEVMGRCRKRAEIVCRRADVGTEIALCSETDRVFVGDLTGAIHVFNAKDAAALGDITTNPPILAARIEQSQQALMQAEAAANQANVQLAALQKGIADRKAAADAAQKTAAEASAGIEAATKAKAAADADFAAKTQSLQTADANLTAAEAARVKAVAEKDAAVKVHNENAAAFKAANDAVATAETALASAQQNAESKPTDAAAKQAAADAAKKTAEAFAALVAATQKKAEAVAQLAQKSDVAIANTAGAMAAKAARDQAATVKTAAEKQVADATVASKSAQDNAAAKKAEADKAVAAAQVTPDQQKQLDASTAAAKAAADNLTAAKARVERLQAARSRATQTAAK